MFSYDQLIISSITAKTLVFNLNTYNQLIISSITAKTFTRLDCIYE